MIGSLSTLLVYICLVSRIFSAIIAYVFISSVTIKFCGFTLNLSVGKRAFIAGIADDNGYGWAIAKSLAAAGAEILVGTWVPVSTTADNGLLCFYKVWSFRISEESLKCPFIGG